MSAERRKAIARKAAIKRWSPEVTLA
jgi:hypothetical protein